MRDDCDTGDGHARLCLGDHCDSDSGISPTRFGNEYGIHADVPYFVSHSKVRPFLRQV